MVEACALTEDLLLLPAGDNTEIGENGVNLSGGQRQRVGLARAVYSLCNTILLDDTFSAVDSKVGRHLFDRLLGVGGILRGKRTVILVTHSLHFLHKMDRF